MRKLWLLIALAACGGKSKTETTENVGSGTDTVPADDACADLKELLAAAPGNFTAVSGEPVPDRPPEGAALQITVHPFGGTCEVAEIAGMNVVSCDTTGSYEEVKAAVAPCVDQPQTSEDNGLAEWVLDDEVTLQVSINIDVDGTQTVGLYMMHPGEDYEPME